MASEVKLACRAALSCHSRGSVCWAESAATRKPDEARGLQRLGVFESVLRVFSLKKSKGLYSSPCCRQRMTAERPLRIQEVIGGLRRRVAARPLGSIRCALERCAIANWPGRKYVQILPRSLLQRREKLARPGEGSRRVGG